MALRADDRKAKLLLFENMKKTIDEIWAKLESGFLNKEEAHAAAYILKEIKRCNTIIGYTVSKKADKKINTIIAGRKIKELGSVDREKMEPHLRAYTRYHEAKAFKKKLHYLSLALLYLFENKTEKEALAELSTKDWRFKNEVTARLSWMRRQQAEMRKGAKFSHPYLCYVGGLKGRRTVDREHFSLMCFLEQYSARRKKKFLFDSVPSESIPKLPRPDFIVKDQHGNLLGLEMTEANAEEDSHFHDENMEWLSKKLKKIFRGENFLLTLHTNPNWKGIGKAKGKSIQWIKEEYVKFKGRENPANEYRAFNKHLNLSFRFTPKESRFAFLDSSEELIGNQPEVLLGKAIRFSIVKKLLKKAPTIRPCFLVVHMRHGVPFMKENIVKREARKGIGTSFKSHFDQIWAVKEARLMRII